MYKVLIHLESTDLEMINSTQQKITFVKQTLGVSDPTSPPSVAWAAFSPFANNIVTWKPEYSLYHTTVVPDSNNPIFANSRTPYLANDGFLYPFQNYAFRAGLRCLSKGRIGIQNNHNAPSCFGMEQEITVNGQSNLSPTNIFTLLTAQKIEFEPSEKIYVFLTYPTVSGTIVSGITSKPLWHDLETSQSITLRFNRHKSQFYVSE